jgi:hypothetical protein
VDLFDQPFPPIAQYGHRCSHPVIFTLRTFCASTLVGARFP